jgi:uroporphyrin-III C-methyltransferase/precorrin-2 dehydrogenase/sirohydrochlorin ferrochelatase/uroporphyrin-III C-methyltransferase
MSARVFLVGAGPGDPDLLTIKAHRLLQSADVILHDSLVDPRILSLAADHAELVDVGKRCGKHSATQTTINELLVNYARTGQITVRLKGGDPMIFGRATEELESLQAAKIDCEIIPGITAATAAAASLQRSLTQRGIARSLHFLTGHGAEGGLPAHDWVALTRAGGTLVVYMGSQTVAGLASHLIEAGMNPAMPAIAVENASLSEQNITSATISTLPSQLGRPSGPTILLIGAAMVSEDEFALAAAQLMVG